MVLFTTEHTNYFDPDLLERMANQKYDEVISILKRYRCYQNSQELSELKDTSQSSLLHYASKYGNKNIVEYLLDSKCEIDAQDNLGRSPLMLAIQEQHEEVFEALLKAKANVHLKDRQGKSTLQMIFELETINNSMLAKLCQHSSWQRDPCHGDTFLHKAVQLRNFKIVKKLIELGADVNASNFHSETPLYYVCRKCDNEWTHSETLEVAKALMSRETFTTTRSDYGYMQIFNVLIYGNYEAIEVIFQSNIDLCATDNEGTTVLHYLARNRNVDPSKLLRGRKFDVNVRNNYGYTPLHSAACQNSFHAVKFLVENEANVNELNDAEETPLYLLFHRHVKSTKRSAEYLLQYGADPQVGRRIPIFAQILRYRQGLIRVDMKLEESCFNTALPVLARLAIIQGLGVEITESTRNDIGLQMSWIKYFEKCVGQIGQMQEIVICDRVTLFRFLTDAEKEITSRVCNEELVSKLEKEIERFEKDSPYPKLLRRRLQRAIQLAELKEKAIDAIIGRIVGSKSNFHYVVAEYIVEFLSFRDMESLVLVRGEPV